MIRRTSQAFVAASILFSLVLIMVYSNLSLETTSRHRVPAEESPKGTETPGHTSRIALKPSAPQAAIDPVLRNISAIANLRLAFPQNGAYWNRLLYGGLQQLEEAGFTLDYKAQGTRCREVNHEVLQINVHDFAAYPKIHQEFVRGLKCRHARLLIDQPRKCVADEGADGNHTFLLFAVKSVPSNFRQRQAVRETWGQGGVYHGGLSVRTVFLLASSSLEDPDLTALLSFEAEHFGDVLQWDFEDSLFNLTLKMYAFLEWSLENCPHVSFVFSGDDDVFVNTPAMLSYLRSLKASEASQAYVGHVISSAGAHRDPNNKYYIPLSFFDGSYPSYVGGGGILIGGAMLKSLHLIATLIPLFPIDDVYVGMCFKALGVSPQAHGGFHTFDIRQQDRENVCVHKELIMTHQRTPHEIKRLWKGIHSPLLAC